MKKQKITFKTVGQFFYLTTKFYMKNNLNTSASACALGFLFSFIPITVIIMIFLVQILHTSPEILFRIFDMPSIFVDSEKILHIAEEITAPGNSSFITILLVISIFWMGQRFFFSVKNGMTTIFHLKIKQRPFLESVFLILGEIIFVIAIVLTVFILVTVKALLSKQAIINNFIIPYFPKFIVNWIKAKVFNILPFVFIWILSAIMYKFSSGSKPKWKLCFSASLLCTAVFWLVTFFMKMFLNLAKYNLIYGVLSSLILLLLEVYVFFMLFFYAAQSIFTFQFFNSLLLSELYLWKQETENKMTVNELLKQFLFSVPNQLISEDNKRLIFERGDVIYSENDMSDGIYYVIDGEVEIYRENYRSHIEHGQFFGDIDCTLEQRRTFNVRATTKTTLIFITKKQFNEIIESDPEVGQKIIEAFPEHINHVYGRK